MKTEKETTQAALLAFKEHANAVNIQPYSFIVGYTAALKASQWIDIKETKPELRTPVLVYADGEMFTAYYTDKWYLTSNSFVIFGVTHWQPLPTPPEV